MRLLLLPFLICLGVLSDGCAQKLQPIVASPTQRMCPRHHIALITVHGSVDTTVDCALPTEDYSRFVERYPCAIGILESADPKQYSTPKDITYCPKCEAANQRLRH